MKKWFLEHFLPMWAKETVLADNRRLRAENDELKQKLQRQQAYILGMETALRSLRRITINSGGKHETL